MWQVAAKSRERRLRLPESLRPPRKIVKFLLLPMLFARSAGDCTATVDENNSYRESKEQQSYGREPREASKDHVLTTTYIMS